MKLAFCLYRYFPFGGLQRDFLRIARACLLRGHEVTVYTGSWEGEPAKDLRVEILPVSGWQNHTRCRSFSRALAKRLKTQEYDLVVGFNKMPGLDVYYGADVCYASRIQKQKPFWYTWLPRFRHYLEDERQVFAPDKLTKILVLTEKQKEEYRACYPLPAERFFVLPPGISRDRQAPKQAETIRETLRTRYLKQRDDFVLLLVGSGFKTKGLDRVIQGLAALPEVLKQKTQLWVVGQDKAAPFLQQAKDCGLNSHIHFFGGRHDVANFFLAADLLVHPAYHENTGTVILEALVAGLPVLTLDVCGYAPYVSTAKAGLVLASPFDQKQFNHALQNVLLSSSRPEWKRNALNFAETADIYSLPEKAATLLETFAAEPKKPSSHTELRVKEAAVFESYMRLQGECFRKQDGRCTQRVFLEQQSYFIKQHSGVGWKEIFKNLFQLKLPVLSAKNEWRAIMRLRKQHVLTPRLKAYGSRGWNPARLRSFILMEEIQPAVSLEDFCRDWKNHPPAFSLKLALIRKLAAIAKTMHETGIHHRDFYLCHFLLDPRSLKEKKLLLYLIDLHRAGLHLSPRSRWIIKDLAGLYFSSKEQGLSQRDYFRFIKHYRMKPLRAIIEEEKPFWRRVTIRGEKLYHAHTLP